MSTAPRRPGRSLCRPLLLLAAAAASLTSGTVRAQTAPLPSATALRQIESLSSEKRSRTPAQRKLDSQLLYALRMGRGEALASGVPSLPRILEHIRPDGAGRVEVDVHGTVDADLEKAIRSLGPARGTLGVHRVHLPFLFR